MWIERAALVVAGAAAAWLVGRAGEPAWRVLRVVVVAGLSGAAVVAVGRWRWRPRGVLCLLVGWLATAAGLGISAQWLEEGPSVTAAAGVLGAVAGAVLVAAGLRDVTVGRHGWRRAVAVVVALPVLVVGVYVVAVPVAATNVPAGDPPPPATRLGGRPARPVDIEGDGARLAAWWVPPAGGGTVVVLPGSGSTRAAARRQAGVLARAGHGVLVVDPRGHGASGGTAMDLGWTGDADVTAAVDEALRRSGGRQARVGVLGLSMGGEEAIGAAAADPRIAVVVAEGATGRTAADKTWLSEEYGAAGTLQEQVDRLTFGVADLLTAASPPTPLADAVDGSDARFLLIAAGEVPDEAHVARRLRARAPGRVEVWVVPGAGHTDGLATAPGQWRERVLETVGAALQDR